MLRMVAKMLACICVWVAVASFVDAEQYLSVYDRRGFPFPISSGPSHSQMRESLAEESDVEMRRGRVDMSHECKKEQENFFPHGINIVRGIKVRYPERHPWMVSLHHGDGYGGFSFACGATVVARRWILTAAHCLTREDATKTIGPNRCLNDQGQEVKCYLEARDVKFGYVLKQGKKAGMKAKKLYPYEKYKVGENAYDIALVKLKRKIPRDKYVPICLSMGTKMDYSRKKQAFLIGWGKEDAGLAAGSDWLKETFMDVFPAAECNSMGVPPKTILCAKWPDAASCSGDSGGPLSKQRDRVTYLLGVLNTGAPNCDLNSQTTFARVYKYRKWITKHIERRD